MTQHETKLRQILCKAIRNHNTLRFYYESSSGKYWRKVDPYILAIKDKGAGNTFFTGYVHPSSKNENKNDNQGQYLLNKIDTNRFKVLDKKFNKLKLDYDKIFGELPTIKMISRVAFNQQKKGKS